MIKVVLEDGVKLPSFESEMAAGADITARSVKMVFSGIKEITGERLEKIQKDFQERGSIKMRSHERILFGTGIHIAYMDPSFELQVRNRSGMALKTGLLVANSPGTIDADYRGEIGIILVNTTEYLGNVIKDSRIAQIVPKIVTPCEFVEVDTVEDTQRGFEGFGSTGK